MERGGRKVVTSGRGFWEDGKQSRPNSSLTQDRRGLNAIETYFRRNGQFEIDHVKKTKLSVVTKNQ